MWGLPRPGIEPVSPALASRFLTTAPSRESQQWSSLSLRWLLWTSRLGRAIWVSPLFLGELGLPSSVHKQCTWHLGISLRAMCWYLWRPGSLWFLTRGWSVFASSPKSWLGDMLVLNFCPLPFVQLCSSLVRFGQKKNGTEKTRPLTWDKCQSAHQM